MAAPTSIPNPPMPLLTPIPGGFLHGKIIRIQGALSPTAQRFAINLQCGPNTNPRDDLALHINARMHERALVRNSLLSGVWGIEERQGPMFPFVPGQGFEIVILADAQHYKVAVNGQHFAEFRCRTPMERVSYISADGEFMITMLTFEGGSHFTPGMQMPAPMPMPMPMPAPMPGVSHGHGHGHGHSTYPQAPGMYPTQPGMGYPTQPGMGYPTQPGMHGAPGMHPTSYAHLSPKSAKKAAKKQAKAQKKAMKYGLPIAGAGIGAYALHHGMKHHHHGYHGHSSSSSSSSSEEE